MRFVGNVLYLLTGGIVLSLGWLCAALVFWLLVFTRPLAASCLQLAGLSLWPGGRDVVRAAQIETYRSYIRTGERPQRDGIDPSLWAVRCIETVLWLPIGTVLMLGHFLHAGLMVFPVFTNGFARQDIGLAGIAMFPFGAQVTSAGQARIARHVERSPCGRARSRRWMLLAQPLTAISAAALILWVPSDNRAHAPPPAAVVPQAYRDWSGLAFGSGPALTIGDVNAGRPQAGPPLPAAWEIAASVPPLAADDCVSSQPDYSSRLSRRTESFGARPLGSRRVASRYGLLHPSMVRKVANIERWIGQASFWNGKAPAAELCRSAVLAKIARASPMPVSRKSMAALAKIERAGRGALHAQARSVAPLRRQEELLLSAAKRPELAALNDAAASLTIH